MYFFGVKMKSLGDEIGVCSKIAGRIAQQQGREGWIIIHNDAPIAIEDFPAWG